MQEKELIKECINGNRSTQHLLYNKYAGMMLGVCYRYTKNIADAEDILQEGYNNIEAAKLLNVNENTIRSQYSRARTLLIQALKKISEQTEKQNYAGRI